MTNYPFKHWYSIVDGGCWYIGYHSDIEAAREQAIKQFKVQHSKSGYCILDRDTLKITNDVIQDRLKKDTD